MKTKKESSRLKPSDKNSTYSSRQTKVISEKDMLELEESINVKMQKVEIVAAEADYKSWQDAEKLRVAL